MTKRSFDHTGTNVTKVWYYISKAVFMCAEERRRAERMAGMSKG